MCIPSSSSLLRRKGVRLCKLFPFGENVIFSKITKNISYNGNF